MKMKRILITMASVLSGLIPVTFAQAQTQETNGTTEAGVPRQLTDRQNAQVVIQWLISNRIMDHVSATELVLTLTTKEIDALVSALSNPRIQKASNSIVIVRGH